jgi:hypothetical protein
MSGPNFRNHWTAKGRSNKPYIFDRSIPCENRPCRLRWGWCMLSGSMYYHSSSWKLHYVINDQLHIFLLDCQMIIWMLCECNSFFFSQNNKTCYEQCMFITGLPAYSPSVPYRRDLLMLGHPDGWRLPCPDTKIWRKIGYRSHLGTQSDFFLKKVTCFITVPAVMADLLSYAQ